MHTILMSTLLFLTFCQIFATQAYFETDTDFLNEAAEAERTPWFYGEGVRRRCPLCDSSVYSYCSEKLFHDSCCCHNPNNPYDRLPYQCQFADCSFLHANSCADHKLITACCCI